MTTTRSSRWICFFKFCPCLLVFRLLHICFRLRFYLLDWKLFCLLVYDNHSPFNSFTTMNESMRVLTSAAVKGHQLFKVRLSKTDFLVHFLTLSIFRATHARHQLVEHARSLYAALPAFVIRCVHLPTCVFYRIIY